jgi:uncharacterized protein (TIGR02996 family)
VLAAIIAPFRNLWDNGGVSPNTSLDDLSAFRIACKAEPDDAAPRLILADWLDEHEDPRGTVMRLGCRLRSQVGGMAFPDENDAFWMDSTGWEAVQRPLKELMKESPPSDALRQRYGRLLRGDVPLEPENLEAALRLQYDLQVRMLESLGLPPDRGITAVDGKRYPLPAFEQILAKVQTPEMMTKLKQGFDTLVLVPFGLELERFIQAWGRGLMRNRNRVPELRNLNQREPVWVWNQYRREPLVYEPHSFTDHHGGRTKEEILREDGRGWDVLLVEGMTGLPREGQGKRIGGRRQVECGRTPQEYVDSMPNGEVGWTPETYIVRFLDALERTGTVLDHQTASWLTSSYFPTSRVVPRAYWYPICGQAYLDGAGPDIADARDGARAAVRVR